MDKEEAFDRLQELVEWEWLRKLAIHDIDTGEELGIAEIYENGEGRLVIQIERGNEQE